MVGAGLRAGPQGCTGRDAGAYHPRTPSPITFISFLETPADHHRGNS